MNKKPTLTLAALMLLATGSVSADNKLIVADASTEQSVAEVALSSVSKMSFAGGKLVVTLADATTKEVPVTLNTVIRLEGDATAIGDAVADSVQIAYSDELLSATGLEKATATLYSLGGQQVLRMASWDGSPISTASLSRGVYILKVNNQSFKFVKQ